MKEVSSFPLTWPDGWKRTAPSQRTWAKFSKKEREYSTTGSGQTSSWQKTKGLTIADAVRRVLAELQRMGFDSDAAIISTNVKPRLDGLPAAASGEPGDPGVAVYWKPRNKPMRCMAIDRYTRVADNLAAIAATLDAMRAIERHGGAEILDRTFRGFTALPEHASEPWRATLGFGDTEQVTEGALVSRFRELVQVHHPDKGGDADKLRAVVEARQQAMKELNLSEVGAA